MEQNQLATKLNNYIDASIYDTNTQIPAWALKKMRNDLAGWVQTVVTQPVVKGWQVEPYSRYFTAPPGGTGNITVDAQTLWTIVEALDQNGNPQKTLFLSFVSVWYSVAPTFKVKPSVLKGLGKGEHEGHVHHKEKHATDDEYVM